MRIRQLVPLSMLILSGVVTAASISSTIILESEGQAKYDQVVKVDLDKLLDHVKYEISCSITSNHLSNQTYDDIQVFSGGKSEIYVNSQPVAQHNGQISIPSNQVSHLNAMSTYQSDQYIEIRNLDTEDTITVSHCFAKPMTSG